MQINININEYVRVRLTEAGEKAYYEYYRNLKKEPRRLKKTPGGWSEFLVWELMNYFGAQCFNGGEQLFKDNILQFKSPNS